jgi:hypothetical protein
MNGQALEHRSLSVTDGRLSDRLDLSMYARGIYQLILIDGKQLANGRIIKE